MAAETAMALNDRAASFLKKPYARIVIPESDGTYRAEILEFPGCIATGDTSEEALNALEKIALDWLDAALSRDRIIPEPVENAEFSGRLVLRMPKSLHKKAARLAEHDGVSLNQFIIASVAECVGERGAQNKLVINTDIPNMTNIGPFISGVGFQKIIHASLNAHHTEYSQGVVPLILHWAPAGKAALRAG